MSRISWWMRPSRRSGITGNGSPRPALESDSSSSRSWCAVSASRKRRNRQPQLFLGNSNRLLRIGNTRLSSRSQQDRSIIRRTNRHHNSRRTSSRHYISSRRCNSNSTWALGMGNSSSRHWRCTTCRLSSQCSLRTQCNLSLCLGNSSRCPWRSQARSRTGSQSHLSIHIRLPMSSRRLHTSHTRWMTPTLAGHPPTRSIVNRLTTCNPASCRHVIRRIAIQLHRRAGLVAPTGRG